jgi:hypothetical protein
MVNREKRKRTALGISLLDDRLLFCIPFLQGNDKPFFSQGIKTQLPPTDKELIHTYKE